MPGNGTDHRSDVCLCSSRLLVWGITRPGRHPVFTLLCPQGHKAHLPTLQGTVNWISVIISPHTLHHRDWGWLNDAQHFMWHSLANEYRLRQLLIHSWIYPGQYNLVKWMKSDWCTPLVDVFPGEWGGVLWPPVPGGGPAPGALQGGLLPPEGPHGAAGRCLSGHSSYRRGRFRHCLRCVCVWNRAGWGIWPMSSVAI